MRLQISCLYCGYSWVSNYGLVTGDERCSKCSDTNLKVKDLSKNGVDYYRGDVPEEEIESDNNDLINYFDFRGD